MRTVVLNQHWQSEPHKILEGPSSALQKQTTVLEGNSDQWYCGEISQTNGIVYKLSNEVQLLRVTILSEMSFSKIQ